MKTLLKKAQPARLLSALTSRTAYPAGNSGVCETQGNPCFRESSITPVTEGGAASLRCTKLLPLLYGLGQWEGTEPKVRTGRWRNVCPSISVPVVSSCREHALPDKALTILEFALITWAQENREGKRTMLSLCLLVGCLEPKTS